MVKRNCTRTTDDIDLLIPQSTNINQLRQQLIETAFFHCDDGVLRWNLEPEVISVICDGQEGEFAHLNSAIVPDAWSECSCHFFCKPQAKCSSGE
jgi:hypothetical protein